jgi:hypothetical protein
VEEEQKQQQGKKFNNHGPGQVEILFNILPQEENKDTGLRGAKAITVRGGAEVLFYGGFAEGVFSSVWKYQVSSRQWTYLGNMTQAR